MKVYIQNQSGQEINLTDRDYITEGGEGKIYGKDKFIYKLYSNPKKIIPTSKINELQLLNKSNILFPQSLILDKNKQPVGIVMLWIKNSVPICKLFTNDYRKRFNIKPQTILDLVNNMVNDIHYIHTKNCLIVDGNEMNYLVDSSTYNIPYFIDVDSYQTKSFPATAITPSIQDFHSKNFSELTDWFSFAIIAFQLFIGIHPYKGNHPKYKKFELEKRMKDNVSVFNSSISLPASVRDFSYIPDNYRIWFETLFEKGKRELPPTIIGRIKISIATKIIKSSNSFDLTIILETDSDIIKYYSGVSLDNNYAYYNKLKIPCNNETDIIFDKLTNNPIFVNIVNNKLEIKDNKQNIIPCNIQAINKVIINNMLFVFNGTSIIEVDIDEINNKQIVLVKAKWEVLPNSTKLFDGIIYQDILGVPYFMIPYKNVQGKTCCFIGEIKELKKYRIIEVKHDLGIIIVIGYKNNKYSRFIIKFDKYYSQYNCSEEHNINYYIPNFVTLDNGIVVSINQDESVEIFSSRLDKNDIKIINDNMISSDMKLCKKGVNVYVRKDNKLYSLTMKK